MIQYPYSISIDLTLQSQTLKENNAQAGKQCKGFVEELLLCGASELLVRNLFMRSISDSSSPGVSKMGCTKCENTENSVVFIH